MRSGFFNSNIIGYDEYGNPQYDRAEDAAFFAAFFAAFIGNGVYPNPSDGMQVIENSNLGVLIKPGKCFINGYFGLVEEGGETLSFETADTTLSRIDRVVARWDLQSRDINLFIVKGNPASSPVAPELTRNSNIYELGLADVKIPANATVITQANITDLRLNASLCGVVVGVIEQIDTTTLFNQYQAWFKERQAQADSDYQEWFDGFATPSEAEFETWFEQIKGQLSEDAAGNLQNQIEDLDERVNTNEENIKSNTTKLNSIEEGAQKNTITGVKGGVESSYRSGNVNLTPANIGALPISGGTLTGNLIARKIQPSADRKYSLGSAGALWSDAWLYRIDMTNTEFYDAGGVSFVGVDNYFTCRAKGDYSTYKPMEASAFNQLSSKRYKKNIIDMTEEEADKLDEINIVKFDYINEKNGTNIAGVIAEEAFEVLPNVVTLKEIKGDVVPDSVDYSKFVPYLIKKIQMLEKRISELENKN